MTGQHSAGHGSLAAEASLLLDVVADKLEPIVQAGRERAAPQEPDVEPDAKGATATGTSDEADAAAGQPHQPCTSCPICVLITVVKSDNGQINQRLAEGALMVVNALRTMLTDATVPQPPTPPANPVQHIDIH